MTIAWQLVYEFNNYEDGAELFTSRDYELVEKEFHEFLGKCLMESVIGNNDVDYVAIETIDVEFDSDGNLIPDDDNDDDGEVAIEYIFNQPKDA